MGSEEMRVAICASEKAQVGSPIQPDIPSIHASNLHNPLLHSISHGLCVFDAYNH